MRLQSRAATTPWLEINGTENGTPLKAWGTTFNELDWDALQMPVSYTHLRAHET